MLKYCIEKWDKYNGNLRKAIENDKEINSCDYRHLVELVTDKILNGDEKDQITWDSNRITEIDDGDYQGTLLYVIPQYTYQPCEYEYLMTYVSYGSCSYCDTLQSIQDFRSNEVSKEQIDGFMRLCKDLLTAMICPYNFGWRVDERFIHVQTE